MLDKTILAEKIKAAFDSESNKEIDSPAKARERIAQKMADAIDNYIRGGEVTTAVTGTSPSGAVTGTGKGAIT